MEESLMKKKSTPKKTKKPTHAKAKRARSTFEERLLSMDDDMEYETPTMNETLRAKLLKEEFKLRKKQPTAWTKTKYRKYAMLNKPKKAKEKVEIQEEHELKD